MAGWRIEDLEDVMGENGEGPPLRVQRSTVARHRARSSPVRGILHVTDLTEWELLLRLLFGMPTKSNASSRRKAPKPPWKKSPPRGTRTSKLTSAQNSKAKASAKRAGRPYPNLVDNMRVAAGAGRKKDSGKAKRKART
jgi:hypothetical protein